MKFLKAVFEEAMKILIMAAVAISAMTIYERWTYEEPVQKNLIDIYKRDNTVHKI